ncbi:MAG: transketolase family protein [Chloroflexi bacterium]|nr:transketolase family protein [Chloroflexota bacterium]MBM3172760.1 transketolase family protein [Chloroflexota bacterium]MBM3174914.1 transketolase family protein [Chloroflexota bacterium]MBM4449693.1 transketolase family protein [Chloroflexota bacterium]
MAAEKATREAFGEALAQFGKEFPDIVALDADLSRSTMTKYFAQQFPERFFQCGLGEQNMIGVAAGLAASGKIPFAATFAVFASCRCFDQLRMSISQPRLNVKVIGTHGGITVGEDGASHHAIEDLALFCALPSFTVIVPADAIETVQAVNSAITTEGPFYLRLGRPKVPHIYKEDYQFTLGKAVTLRDGKDATIIANGIMAAKALETAEKLASQKIDCRVLNMHTLKPLDEEAIVAAASQTGAIVTAEEHLLHGGLGSRVAQVVTRQEPVPMGFVGINDLYAKSGKPDELLQKYGLTVEEIEKAVKSAVARK